MQTDSEVQIPNQIHFKQKEIEKSIKKIGFFKENTITINQLLEFDQYLPQDEYIPPCEDFYFALENKFRQLQNDIQCLSEQKILLEQELAKSGNNGNILISKNKSENENFLNELNEKIH